MKVNKISVVTINYNERSGLKNTLQSVAAQQAMLPPDVELEHIIVDGESTDGSLNEVRPDLASQVIISPPKGVYNAINIGLDHTTGDIVGLLHAGDVYTSDDALALIVGRFESTDDIDFIWGDVTIGRRYYSGKKFKPEALETGFAPPHPSLYMRRSLLDRIGPYDERYHTAADFDYFVRLFTDTSLRAAYMPGALVSMEPGGRSASLRSRLWTNNRERLASLRSHGLKASPFALLKNYKNIVSGYLCPAKQKN